MDRRERILKGDLWKLMIAMSLPGILGMVIVSLNALVDAFFVAHLIGNNAFAGVSAALPLFTLNAAVTGMLSSGASTLYSRAIGGEDNWTKKHLFGNLLLLVVGSSLLLAVFGLLFGKTLLGYLGASPNLLAEGTSFYHWSVTGYFTSMLGLCTSGLIRAEGNTAYAMKITAIAVLLNLVLNPLLIKYGNLGVRGSALATIVSMSVYSVLNIGYFLKGKGFLQLGLKFDFKQQLIAGILKTGLPSFLMQVNGFFRQFILFRLANMAGSDIAQFTVFTAIYRLFSFCALPVFGMLQAYAPIVAINYGAANGQRVKDATRIFRTGAFLLMLAMALPGIIFPETMLGLLITDNTASHSVAAFRMVLLVLPLMPFASTCIVYLQSTGNSAIASRLTFSRELVLFLPILLLSVKTWGYQGIYYGLFAENIAYILLVFSLTRVVMRREDKKLHAESLKLEAES